MRIRTILCATALATVAAFPLAGVASAQQPTDRDCRDFASQAAAQSALRSLAHSTLLLYTILIFVYAVLSFVAPGARSPATSLLASLCEPLLRPLRQALPAVGGIDFSPLVAIVGLTAIRILIA